MRKLTVIHNTNKKILSLYSMKKIIQKVYIVTKLYCKTLSCVFSILFFIIKKECKKFLNKDLSFFFVKCQNIKTKY